MKKSSPIVIIPIYKLDLDKHEIISLKKCFEVLSTFDIVFVCSKNLDISNYQYILNQHIKIERFDNYYFESILGYNELMLSINFYERFELYDYMLVYQLDCYVFKDELDFWCSQGYDYIGSPWLEKSYYKLNILKKIKFQLKRFIKIQVLNRKFEDKSILVNNVGNGGFSLRKINTFICVLQNTSDEILNLFKKSNDSKSLFNEDVFWSFAAKGVKKPNYKIALKFGLDLGADIGFKINRKRLPFGCHSWYKKYKYWQEYIEIKE